MNGYEEMADSAQFHWLLLFSCYVVSNSLQPHGLQHTRLPYPSHSPRVCSNSCLLSQWCHPTISSSASPFSCLQSFPASESFYNESTLRIRWPKYWSFSFSISSSNEYSGSVSFKMDWIDLLAVPRLSRVFSSITVWKHQFFSVQPSLGSNFHIYNDYWKNHSFGYTDLCCKVMSLLFNMLSRFVIAFLLRSKRLLI